jgi:branched-chain amino acid transport system ATP-binding protein
MAAGGGEAVLEFAGVEKSFGGLKVIDDVTFDVGRGRRTALIGPNGAGKTTIFNLISGIYDVDDGTITLDGADITGIAARHRVHAGLSRSFQNIRLMPHLSTVENVMLGQHVRARGVLELIKPLGWSIGRHWARQAEEALERFGLGTYPGEVVANLPYGVRKRIEVVRAMMADPKVLLLDEPAAGLNSQESEELQALLRQVSEGGVTLLVVEHDMHFVRRLCEHVIVLNFGRKIFEGTPEEVHKDPGVLEAYLGTGGGEAGDAA